MASFFGDRNFKGQSSMLAESWKIILVFIVGAAVFAFVFTSGGGLEGVVKNFCSVWPGLCGGNTTELTAGTAFESTRVLACGISSVTGNDECITDFEAVASSGATGAAAAASGTDVPSLKCEDLSQTVETKDVLISENGTLIDEREAKANFTEFKNHCDSRGGKLKEELNIPIENNLYNKYTCTISNTKCIVKAFNLPQEFTEYDLPIIGETDFNWMGTFGDPKYLVYWQSFPFGEDAAWSGQSAWYETFGRWMFIAMCIGRILAPLKYALTTAKGAVLHPLSALKTAGGKIGESLSWLSGKIKEFSLPEKGFSIIGAARTGIAKIAARFSMNKAIVDKFGNVDEFLAAVSKGKSTATLTINEMNGIRSVFTNVPKGVYTGADIARHLPTSQVISLITQIIGSPKMGQIASKAILNSKFVAYTGIDAASAYWLARADSELGKFTDEYPSSLVLQKSMLTTSLRTPINLTGLQVPGPITGKIGLPLVLNKPEWLSSTTPLYFVSPCKADLEITKSPVTCSVYAHQMDQDLTSCNTQQGVPFWESGLAGDLQCGDLMWFGNYNFDDTGELITKHELKSAEEKAIKTMGSNIIFPGDSTLTFTDGRRESREKFVDPINNFIYYYDSQENRIDYLSKDGGKTVIWLPNSTLRSDGWSPEYHGGIYSPICSLKEPTVSTVEGEENDIRRVMGEFDQSNIWCQVMYARYYEDLGILASDYYIMDTVVYGTPNENNSTPENFFGISLDYRRIHAFPRLNGDEPHYKTFISLKDDNNDGRLDSLGHNRYILGSTTEPNVKRVIEEPFSTVYSDSDLDGDADDLLATKCTVDAVYVKPDQSPHQEDGTYNFCYQKDYDSALGLVTMTASFGASALTKVSKVGGVTGWAISTAVDCGLAYIHYKYGKTPWPGDKN